MTDHGYEQAAALWEAERERACAEAGFTEDDDVNGQHREEQDVMANALLARIVARLDRISDVQHRLARKKALLQEQATRLRLGASPDEVALRRVGGER